MHMKIIFINKKIIDYNSKFCLFHLYLYTRYAYCENCKLSIKQVGNEPWKLSNESESHTCDVDEKRMGTVYFKNDLINLSKNKYTKKKGVYDAIAHKRE